MAQVHKCSTTSAALFARPMEETNEFYDARL